MAILDGKALAEKIKTQLKQKIAKLKKDKIIPGLAIILVGKDPASVLYTTKKMEACRELGIFCQKLDLPAEITQKDLLQKISELNSDSKIHGILVQLPLPKHLDTHQILQSISPEKDADGLHPLNLGNLLIDTHGLAPATPKGIIYLLESYKVEIAGKHAVIVGRSNILGKPLAAMLLNRDATVTICHRQTKNLANYTRQADILISGAGQAKLITKDMIKPGAVVIDVGVNRSGGKLVGDADFENLKDITSFITPVPGGVGPMTIVMLLENVIQLASSE